MPTLRPQRLSGLIVIPTVELDGNIYRVSLAIDVGESRVGASPPQTVTREDLIAELRNASEGSFEPIASPDPGPLPTRALRVVEARGEFTFGQGVNPPDELVVTVRGDRKSFPMSQTLVPSGGLSQEPNEDDPFPVSPPILPSWLRWFWKLWPFRGRCCIRRFDAPVNTSPDPAAKSDYFEVEADLAALGQRRRCACCEYRQFVRGTFSDAGGVPVRFDLPSGPLDAGIYREDGATQEFGATSHGFYGHRDTSSPGDLYSGTGPNTGCTYRANETPACPASDSAHIEFLGLIVDRCHGRVTAKRKWTVDL